MSLHAPAAPTMQSSMKVHADGTEEWCLPHTQAFGCVYHREDGPAVTRPNGTKEWWIHGRRVYIQYITGEVREEPAHIQELHTFGHTVPSAKELGVL